MYFLNSNNSKDHRGLGMKLHEEHLFSIEQILNLIPRATKNISPWEVMLFMASSF